jgi:hypothetical protein
MVSITYKDDYPVFQVSTLFERVGVWMANWFISSLIYILLVYILIVHDANIINVKRLVLFTLYFIWIILFQYLFDKYSYLDGIEKED